MSIERMYETLTDHGIATKEELALVTSINGDSKETYKDVLFARTGYRTFGQYQSESK